MAAQNATLTLETPVGTKTVDVYLPDAAGTIATFNLTGPAASTSPTTFRTPTAGRIIDVSVAASTTATSAVFTLNSGLVNGGVVRWANQLNTLSSRQKLNIPFNAGDFIGLNQTT
jgi:hypothetical protein